MSPESPGRPARHFADNRRDGGATYESLRKAAQTYGFRLSRRGSVYQILDGDEVLHAGPFDTVAAFLAARPRPPLKYRRKCVPAGWAQPIEDYLLTLSAVGQREATLVVRRSHLTTLARGLERPPEAVTGEVLVSWFGRQKHWTPETRKSYRSAARGFFSWAYRTGRVPAYISDELTQTRIPKAAPRPAPDDAWAAALAAADARTTLMLRLAAEAGLRRAEVAQVHGGDLIDGIGGAQLLVHGKAGKERVVPIDRTLADAIRRQAGTEGWLFPNRRGGHLQPFQVGQLVTQVLPPGYTMHALRHRFATRAYRGSAGLVRLDLSAADTAYPKLLDTWRVHQLARALSLRTVTERERTVIQFAMDADIDPHTATTAQIASWLARGQWTGSTRHTYWTHLNAWFTWLCLNGYRADNPMVPLGAPKRPRYEPRPVSRANVEKLLRARMRPQTRAYLLLALYAGLRVHEIAKARGEDLDLTAGTLTVLGKGGRLDTLPLHPELVALASTMPRSGFWFPSSTHRAGHIAPRSVGDRLKDLLLRNGVRGSAHALRHSFGTGLVTNGADARTAQTLLRHASLQSTQIYVDACDARRLRAIQQLDYNQRQAVGAE